MATQVQYFCASCGERYTYNSDKRGTMLFCNAMRCGGTAYIIDYETRDTNEDGEVRCANFMQFAHFVKTGGWQSIKAFEESTGAMHTELLGKWFTVTHDRVYMGDGIN